MNIPDKIIEGLNRMPFTDRALAYGALIEFIKDGSEPPAEEMTEIAGGAYILAKEVLLPILRRRERDRARRRAKKAAKAADSASPTLKTVPADQPSADVDSLRTQKQSLQQPQCTPEPLPPQFRISRADRRRLERDRRKLAQKIGLTIHPL